MGTLTRAREAGANSHIVLTRQRKSIHFLQASSQGSGRIFDRVKIRAFTSVLFTRNHPNRSKI